MVKSGSLTKKHKLNEFEQEVLPKKMRKNSFNVSDAQDKLSVNSKKKKIKQIDGQDVELGNKKSVLISSYSPQSNIKKEKNLKRKAQDEEGKNDSTVQKLSKKQRKMLNKNIPGPVQSKILDQSENEEGKNDITVQKLSKKQRKMLNKNIPGPVQSKIVDQSENEEGKNDSTVQKLSKKQRKMLNTNIPGPVKSKMVNQSENSPSKAKKNNTTITTQGSAAANQSPVQGDVKLTKNQKRRLSKKLKLQAQKVGSSEGQSSPQKSPEVPSKQNLLTKNQARRIRRNKGKGGQFTNGNIKNVPLAKTTPKSSSKLIKHKEGEENGSEFEDSDEGKQEEESDSESDEEDTGEPEFEKISKKLTKQKEVADSDESETEEEESDDESEKAKVINESILKSKPKGKILSNESKEEGTDEESSDEEGSEEEGSEEEGSEEEDSDEEVGVKDLLDLEAEEGKETSEEESSDDEKVFPKKVVQSNSEDQSGNSEESSDEDKEDFSSKNSTKKIVSKPVEKSFEKYPVSDTKVVLRDLPENVTEEMIRETFSFVGDIKSITIPFNRATNTPKQFAFMVLADKDSAQKVIELSKIAKVGDQVVFIKEYIEYPDDNRGRSPGGGFRGSPGRGGGFRGSGNSEGGDRRSFGGFRGSGERRGGGFRGSRGGGRGGGFRGSRGGDRGGFRGSPRGGGFRGGSRNNEGGGFRGSRGGDRRSSGGFRGKAGGGTYDN